MSGFRHEFQSLILIRNLTTYTPNVDGLKACENAYILVGFIFRLVENLPHAFEAFKIYKPSSHKIVKQSQTYRRCLRLSADYSPTYCSH